MRSKLRVLFTALIALVALALCAGSAAPGSETASARARAALR